MSSESILSIASSVIALVTAGILIQQIKYQKGIIDSMKAYLGVFNVDEVKKYVEMQKENMKNEHEKAMNELKKEIEEERLWFKQLNQQMQDEFLSNSHHLNDKFTYKMNQILKETEYLLEDKLKHDWFRTRDALEKFANQVKLDIQEELKKSK